MLDLNVSHFSEFASTLEEYMRNFIFDPVKYFFRHLEHVCMMLDKQKCTNNLEGLIGKSEDYAWLLAIFCEHVTDSSMDSLLKHLRLVFSMDQDILQLNKTRTRLEL